jgi:hypothetical protein
MMICTVHDDVTKAEMAGRSDKLQLEFAAYWMSNAPSVHAESELLIPAHPVNEKVQHKGRVANTVG